MKKLLVLLALPLTLATPAGAAMIVDTGTPTSGDAQLLYSLQRVATEFSLTGTTTIDSIKSYMQAYSNPSTVTIGIASDGGEMPASMLFSQSFAVGANKAWQGLDNLNWTLNAGSYWVVFSTTDMAGLFLNPPAPLADTSIWTPNSWHNLDVTKIGLRITSLDTVAPVPEPASWALLVGGFAMIGGTMRLRSAKGRAQPA